MKHLSLFLPLFFTLIASSYADGTPVSPEANQNLPANHAAALLQNAQGEQVGQAILNEEENGVRIKLTIQKLPPGEHAFHIHGVGSCITPDFVSAGPHFNPENKKHGSENPEGPHAGDMPNILIGEDGTGFAEVFNENIRITNGPNSILQEGGPGTAVVIHATADDYQTDPAGNAGERIACGVIEKS